MITGFTTLQADIVEKSYPTTSVLTPETIGSVPTEAGCAGCAGCAGRIP